MRYAYEVSVEKPEGKRQLGRSRRRWEGNTGIDIRQIRCEGVDWIHLAQDRDLWRPL
jgi:hypothetical protein